MDIKNIENKHIPVLLQELVENIKIFNDKQNVIVDATLWMGGHASEVIKKMIAWDIFIGFDADIKNLELAKIRLDEVNKDKKIKIYLINSNFLFLKEELEKIWIKNITWIYYDLWISSVHIDEADRWFSFMKDWPLDMRLDKSKWKTASDIVNSYKREDLREIFLKYWEEPKSNRIAEKIIELRKKTKIKRTSELSELIGKDIKTKSRIFQALRIEVNSELDNLEKSLREAIKLLDKEWNIFVISFHSLEDRIVKNIFKEESRDCICEDLVCSCGHKKSLKLISKKPLIPTKEELELNKRSRSSKARAAKKI